MPENNPRRYVPIKHKNELISSLIEQLPKSNLTENTLKEKPTLSKEELQQFMEAARELTDKPNPLQRIFDALKTLSNFHQLLHLTPEDLDSADPSLQSIREYITKQFEKK